MPRWADGESPIWCDWCQRKRTDPVHLSACMDEDGPLPAPPKQHAHSRRASWSRLRVWASRLIAQEGVVITDKTGDTFTLLVCILGASGVGLVLVGAVHLLRGLLG